MLAIFMKFGPERYDLIPTAIKHGTTAKEFSILDFF